MCFRLGREKKTKERGKDRELLNIERVGFVQKSNQWKLGVGTSEKESQHGFEHEKKRKEKTTQVGNHNISNLPGF